MKLLPFLFLLSFACEAQDSISFSGKTPDEIAKILSEQRSEVDTAWTNTFFGKQLPKIDYDELYGRYGAAPLPTRPFPYPKIFNEAAPKVLSLEEKLLLYADECYNDSTLVRVHRDDVNCGWTCPDWHYVGKKYIHREPTFKRFIEWLRKKQ